MRTKLMTLGVAVAAGIAAAGCGGAAISGTQLVASHAPAHLYLVIATPDMLGSQDKGPAYIPSDFTVPANSDVTVTVTNFDDATALTGNSVVYAKATGLSGSFQTAPLSAADPNAASAGPSQSLSTLDPADVSHTFTIPALGVNVPLPAKSRTTFTFHTGAAGSYGWQCFDPCGPDGGWGGAMADAGFMKGTMTVV